MDDKDRELELKRRKLELWKTLLRNLISIVYCLAELSLGYKPENLTDRKK